MRTPFSRCLPSFTVGLFASVEDGKPNESEFDSRGEGKSAQKWLICERCRGGQNLPPSGSILVYQREIKTNNPFQHMRYTP